MSSHEAFPLVSRPYGDTGQLKSMAKISCSRCPKVEWRAAHNQGIANRIFHQSGWLLGSRRTTDVCPDCRKLRAQHGKPMTPASRRAAYTNIEAKRVAEMDANPDTGVGKAVTFASPLREPVTPVISPEIGAVIKEKIAAAHDWPDRVKVGRYKVRTRGFANQASSRRAASSWLRQAGIEVPVPGTHYLYFQRPDGWCWVPIEKATLAEHAAFRAGRKQKVKSIAGKLRNLTKGTSMPDQQVNAQPPPVSVAPSRALTREERRKIIDFMDANYNQEKEQWRGKWTDAMVAATLDTPRAFVTTIRLEIFGDHDRNEFADQQKRTLDEAVVMARNASERLLAMASEAEALARDLEVARAALK